MKLHIMLSSPAARPLRSKCSP